jgi:hypothetical protein
MTSTKSKSGLTEYLCFHGFQSHLDGSVGSMRCRRLRAVGCGSAENSRFQDLPSAFRFQ